MPFPGVGDRDAFERSFDFSKFPHLREVDLAVRWIGGRLLWIPTALSTLRPTTSPCLSVIRLNFAFPITTSQTVETAINDTGNDRLWVADEVTRIEREFEGAVNVTVLRDPGFKVVLDTLNVRFHF